MTGEPLCPVESLDDRAARAFVARDGRSIVVARLGDRHRGYLNICPHLDVALDEAGGGFLNAAGTRLRCSKHGAEFRVTDGLCVVGPCKGWSLTPVGLAVEDGWIRLTAP